MDEVLNQIKEMVSEILALVKKQRERVLPFDEEIAKEAREKAEAEAKAKAEEEAKKKAEEEERKRIAEAIDYSVYRCDGSSFCVVINQLPGGAKAFTEMLKEYPEQAAKNQAAVEFAKSYPSLFADCPECWSTITGLAYPGDCPTCR